MSFGAQLMLGTGFVNATKGKAPMVELQKQTDNVKKKVKKESAQKKHIEGDVTDKGQRQYEHIRDSLKGKRGSKKAKQIAAATVNKGKHGPNRHAKGR